MSFFMDTYFTSWYAPCQYLGGISQMGKRWFNPAMDKSDIRRRRTRLLIDQDFGGVDAALAAALSIQAAYVARWFTSIPEHRRNIGERMARRIEEVGGKPEGWLDREHETESRQTGIMRRLTPDEWQLVRAYQRADENKKAAIQAFVHSIGRKPK
jgi:hypothetical protein